MIGPARSAAMGRTLMIIGSVRVRASITVVFGSGRSGASRCCSVKLLITPALERSQEALQLLLSLS